MLKIIQTLRRKAGLSREEFIRYYEEIHAPLIRSLGSEALLYRRNYILPPEDQILIHPQDASNSETEQEQFDVVTEVVHASREAALAAFRRMSDPERYKIMIDDEAKFIEPGSIKMYMVEVHQSPYP